MIPKDIKIFLILIPCFTLINYFISWYQLTLNSDFILAFLTDTLQSYLCWLIIRFIILKIDKKKASANFSKRHIALQLFLTIIAGTAAALIIPNGDRFITGIKYAQRSNFYFHDFLVYIIWVIIVNIIYIGIKYYDIWKKFEQKLINEQKLKNKVFTVKIGDKNIRIPIKDIRGFYVEDGCTFLIDTAFKTYILESSLDNLEQNLPAQFFFRVNRKFILHRNAIISFKRVEDNKLIIYTLEQPPLPGELPMSRLKAPAFKKWFEQDAAL